MRLEARKYLHDINQAINLLTEFTAGRSYDDYSADKMLRAAVEREFEIVGEALSQLGKLDREIAARISEHRLIIGFRNILIHGYAEVENALVWDIVETKLPLLKSEVEALLKD